MLALQSRCGDLFLAATGVARRLLAEIARSVEHIGDMAVAVREA